MQDYLCCVRAGPVPDVGQLVLGRKHARYRRRRRRRPASQPPWHSYQNSLAPGRSFENVIFNLALLICIFKSSHENVLRWMPQELTDDKWALVQVMAWCSVDQDLQRHMASLGPTELINDSETSGQGQLSVYVVGWSYSSVLVLLHSLRPSDINICQ